jgi:glycerophosphoryl diester phosphodiesterase
LEIYAHRGSSLRHPENTMAAFTAALEEGATGIETDLRLTRDGVIVLAHDPNLRRVAGDRRRISDLTRAEIDRIGLAQGHRVPILDDLWDLAHEKVRLNLEIKDPLVTPMLVGFLRNHPGDVLVTSFHLSEIDAARSAKSDVPVGPVLNRLGPEEMRRVAGRGYDAVSLAARSFSERALDFCHKERMRLLLWVVNRPRRVLHFAEMGVDAVFTDAPGPAAAALRARGFGPRKV